MNVETTLRNNLKTQFLHWQLALSRLEQLDDIASLEGWSALERHTGTLLRATLQKAVRDLAADAASVRGRFDRMPLEEIADALQRFRQDYLRTETTLDFFADAINTRTSARIAGLLSAADALAAKSMSRILSPLGHTTPPVVCYLEKGRGASILKANIRLWDRKSINPVAMIKVVRHNILRPTALIHEAGHQIAHILDWNDQLAAALSRALPSEQGLIWGSWASEIAADAFSFVNTGYASVAALRNVVDGGRRLVFRYLPGDPHPIAYLRVLLGVEMCRQAYGSGPWDELASGWRYLYPLRSAPADIRAMLRDSTTLISHVAKVTLRKSYAAFDDRSLTQMIDPAEVSPASLAQLERAAGPRLYESPYVVNHESLRLLALSGYQFATQPERGAEVMHKQLTSMLLLGRTQMAA